MKPERRRRGMALVGVGIEEVAVGDLVLCVAVLAGEGNKDAEGDLPLLEQILWRRVRTAGPAKAYTTAEVIACLDAILNAMVVTGKEMSAGLLSSRLTFGFVFLPLASRT
jgi:hypothetical protein